MSKTRLNADLVVIGAGSGGLSVASGAAQLGLNVVLFEKGEMGGDCLNTGCVPSKALLAAAKTAHTVRKAGKYGIVTQEPSVKWTAVKAHLQGVIDQIAPVDSQERFEGLGCTVIRELAQFNNKTTITSDSYEVKARRIVIATGSHPLIPPIPGLEACPYITNETIFDLPDLPSHLVILGGGPIGMEMAQAFKRLGSEVTVVEMGKALGVADPAHAGEVVHHLREEGITVLEGHKATSVSASSGEVLVTAEHEGAEINVKGSHLLVALGRAPALHGLNLEAGGVDFTPKGITTKPNLRSVSNSRVWAVGDIAGRGQFTHLAGWHASIFVQAALMKLPAKAVSEQIPAVTYTDPEIAQIGLSEQAARERDGDDLQVIEFPFEENDRAIAERQTAGSAKLFIGKGDKILGASILGQGAGDILQIVSLAMANKLKMRDLTKWISPYPTRAEVVKRVASLYFQPKVFGAMARKIVSITQRIP
ncbi:MAG: dihydrolipoamide dehydrogenase [Hyphomonadaceae bacterium TMED5]|nr:MAG: dihydrolipoamide dehydrogenase [Hyphomonadaceae bacterium TMED5]